MAGFFKTFFASLLAIIVFFFGLFFLVMVVAAMVGSQRDESVGSRAVLVIDLNQHFAEIEQSDPLSEFGRGHYDIPSLYDLVRMIRYAKSDSAIKGIYIRCGANDPGFAAAREIRDAIAEFKKDGKFVYAFADVINQRAYYIANIADKIYCNPKGGLEWDGFVMQLPFLKGALEKLEIEPQIFYAGKFKSATEPLREKKMTEANRIQSSELLNDLYGDFLMTASAARKIDTATLHRYADENLIRFPAAALQYGLVDGLKYDDEVKEEIKLKLKLGKEDKINFISPGKYAGAADFKGAGKEKIAVIFAEGDIIDGKGDRTQIGSETYRNYIRNVRLDESVKAIVLRVNSGGGSSLASENIWRELTLARQKKPVIVSFGDVAASGGYYIACAADSIFAQTSTITGSIGVFSVLPNAQGLLNNKLGVTFDQVKTSPDADAMSITKPLSPVQKQYLQEQIDSIYFYFKTRVAEGRKLDIAFVDSIAQGRVWSGARAVQLGLVDRIGGLGDAIASAAQQAKVKEFRLKEYPGPQGFLDNLFNDNNQSEKESLIKDELGEEGFRTYEAISKLKQFIGVTQTRMPFEFRID